MKRVECQQVSFQQRGRFLVRDFSWSAHAGEIWLILGQNGVGKSTFLKALMGLHPLDSGDIFLAERPLLTLSLKERAQACSALLSPSQDVFSFSVKALLEAARYPWNTSAEENQQHLKTALAQFELTDDAARALPSLSSGERQRAALAALAAQDTPLILLDEPCSALDLAHHMKVLKQIQQWASMGKTIVMVTHNWLIDLSIATHVLLFQTEAPHALPIETLTPAHLSSCFEYPVETLKRVFLPS